VGKLIEVVHVSPGGQIDPLDWAFPYLDDEHLAFANERLQAADALLLGRRTYEGLSSAYPAMSPSPFVDRMNAIPKYIASRTLRAAAWNATVIEGEVTAFVANLKNQQGLNLLKFGNGPLDVVFMEHGLIDEIHILLTPVAVGKGRRMFEELEQTIHLTLLEAKVFRSGVVRLVYKPRTS
jgi:dihydrofolate reductase